jgi:hypothetical protein
MKIESKKPHAPLSSLCGKALAAVALLVLLPSSMLATTYYVSTTGKDTNSGSSSAPLATITRALTLATASGDQILLDAGTYNIPNAVAGYEDGNAYAAVILLSSANSGITIEANPSDTSRPVLNFSAINPSGYRVAGIWIPSGVSNVTFQGFDVTGIKENITDKNNQSIGIAIWGGSGCTFNQVNVHDADCVGFYLEEVSSKNTFYQCDAYNLAGIDSYSYGNADGFGCHPAAGGTGNVYNQCRSWNNSDDGYDCINAAEPVTFEHCWSYLNGNNGGNGNGFKLGGWGSQPQDEIPNPIPAHSCTYCLAADDNGNAGFYTNHQPSGPGSPSVIEYNTAYGCATGFSLLERTEPNYSSSADQTNSNDISGINVTLHYNLAFDNTTTVVSLNDSASMDSDNSFTESITLAASDFHSTDASQITEARQSNGSLPAITFMVPVKGSAAAGLGCFTAD